MTFDLSIIFDVPESQYLRCVASNVNVAFAFKIRNHRALRCFLDLSKMLSYQLQNYRDIFRLRSLLEETTFTIDFNVFLVIHTTRYTVTRYTEILPMN